MDAPRQVIGILGGSFNPVHVGHVMVAAYLAQCAGLDAVWLTLSPLNPLKARPEELLPDILRLDMLQRAAQQAPKLGVCDIELSLPRPSYTAQTLRALARKYPRKEFKLIIGSDNWRQFTQWHDYRWILDNHGIIVYPRPGYPVGNIYEDNVEVVNAPACSLSSTMIRRLIAQRRDIRGLVPAPVAEYITEHNLYQPGGA